MSIHPTTDDGLTRSVFLRRAGLGAMALSVPSLLAACGGSDSSNPAAGGAKAATDLPQGPFSFLSSLDPGAPLTKAFDEQRDRWNADHPDEQVTFENAPFATFLAAATTRARANRLEDVVQMLAGQAYKPLFPTLLELDKASFGAAGEQLTGWGTTIGTADRPDVHVAVPMGSVGIVWYYNRELFERAGLDPATPPATWDDFTAAARALKAKDIVPIGMSGVDSYFAWWAWNAFSPQFFRTDEELLSVLAGETPLDDERMLQSLEPIKETYDSGWWNPDFRDQEFADVEAKFAKGEVAMVSGLTTDIAHWKVWDRDLGPGKYGSFVAPQLPVAEERGLFYNPSQMLGISKDTKAEGSAREWCEFLTSKEVQTALLQGAGQFPNRTDIDVGAVTGSDGAKELDDLIKEYDGGVNSVQNQFNAGATGLAYQKLTTAITSGDLKGFLRDLQRQQEQ